MQKSVEIINAAGAVEKVELVTYLISEDGLNKYLVYTKGEKQGTEGDQVIYISKVVSEDGALQLKEIVDDSEWASVQHLLKGIANA